MNWQPTPTPDSSQHVGQTRLEETGTSTRQLVDLGLVDVDSQHVVAKFGHTHCVGRPRYPVRNTVSSCVVWYASEPFRNAYARWARNQHRAYNECVA